MTWFEGGKLNVTYNCLDRHLATRGDQVAIIWEGDDPSEDKKITYRQLHAEVNKFANVLKGRGVKKGDRVCIYVPLVPEQVISMLACARLGAIHSVVFGGFGPAALNMRIQDASAKVVISADIGMRGGKTIQLKSIVEEALINAPSVEHVIVLRRQDPPADLRPGLELDFNEIMESASQECPPIEAVHCPAGTVMTSLALFEKKFTFDVAGSPKLKYIPLSIWIC